MKIRLEGNHSRVHAGCRAVWSVLHDLVRRQGHQIVGGDDYDLLLVNGEGSMHHGAPTFHRKMEALRGALKAGRRAALVNSVWQDNPPDYDGVLRALDVIVVREPMSRRDLARRHDLQARVAPDISLHAPIDAPDLPVEEFGGEVVATDYWSHEFGHFVRPSAGPLSHWRPFDLDRGNWSTAVQSLRTAGVLVTGRQHAVYAACKAHVPFVALAGNTHKIEGFLELAGVSIPVFRRPADLAEGLKGIGAYHDEYRRLFAWCDAQEPGLPALDAAVSR